MEEEKIFVLKEICEIKDDKNINDENDLAFPFFQENSEDNNEVYNSNMNIEEEKDINQPDIYEKIIEESKNAQIKEENPGKRDL